MKVLTYEQIGSIEKNAAAKGLEYLRMMENAGSAAAKRIVDSYPVSGAKVTVMCGKGNNGGDGFVVARKLHDAGADVTLILTEGLPQTEAAKQMYSRAYTKVKTILKDTDPKSLLEKVIVAAELVVDAVHGIGFHGVLSEEITGLFEVVNQSRAVRIAIDLPSGIECDSGAVSEGCFIADYTLSFIALKPAHVLSPSQKLCGIVETLSIGIPQDVLDGETAQMYVPDGDFVKAQFTPRETGGNKGTYGRPLLVCGSTGMAGAAKLSALGALRSGAGVVRLAIPSCIYLGALAASLVEPVFALLPSSEDGGISREACPAVEKLAERSTACLIGPGMGKNEDTAALIYGVVQNTNIPLVIDADGINCLCNNINILRTTKAPVIVTPHPGEMARMTGITIEQIQADRVGAARKLAKKVGVIVVLKGEGTVVALPDGTVYINTTGNPGMATGGSGDVLGGMIVALIGQGLSPEMAAVCGVFLHGKAGDRAALRLSQRAMLPTDLVEELSGVFLEIES